MFLVFCSYALCASTFTIAKAALSYAQPFLFVGIRMSVAGILLLTYEYVRHGRSFFSIGRSDVYLFIRVILFHIYGAYIAEMWAQQYLASFQTACFYNLSPLITALFSYWLLSERISAMQIVGLVLGFFGVMLPFIGTKTAFFSGSLPECAMMFAVVCSVYGWLTVKELLQKDIYSPLFINGIGMVGGGLLALLTSAFCELWQPGLLVSDWPSFMLFTLLIILFANILFYNVYGFLLKRYTATFLSFAGFSTPFFAALFGILFLSESVDGSFFLSMLLVGIGLYLFYQEELRHQGYAVSAHK